MHIILCILFYAYCSMHSILSLASINVIFYFKTRCDRMTDIVLYRATIAAKSPTFLGLKRNPDFWFQTLKTQKPLLKHIIFKRSSQIRTGVDLLILR